MKTPLNQNFFKLLQDNSLIMLGVRASNSYQNMIRLEDITQKGPTMMGKEPEQGPGPRSGT